MKLAKAGDLDTHERVQKQMRKDMSKMGKHRDQLMLTLDRLQQENFAHLMELGQMPDPRDKPKPAQP
jgi:hypothetical protein